MRRPFVWPGLGLAIGIGAGKFVPFPASWVFFLIIFLLPFLWFSRGKRFYLPLFLVVVMATGVLRIKQSAELPSHHVRNFATGQNVALEGRVSSLPEVKEKGRRRIFSFVLDSTDVVCRREFYQTTGKVQVFLFNPAESVTYGSRVRLWGRLKLPKSPRNPGEFDYRKYLARQGIGAVLEGYGRRSQRTLPNKPGFLDGPLIGIQKLRERTARRLDRLFDEPLNFLLKALLLGIRKGLPEEWRDSFMKTGTTHLLAISGMNITLVAGSLFFLGLLLGLPQKGAAVVGLVSTVSYVFLSGAGVPVVRAGWMAGLFFTGLLLEREKDLLNSLFFALLLILALDPEALFQVGFQLSFLSVLSLVLLRPNSAGRGWEEVLQTALVLVGTFPLGIFYFNVFSWAALFANLFAIPLFHLGVLTGIAGLLVGPVPGFGPFWIHVTEFFLKAGLAWILLWARMSWSYFHVQTPSWGLIAFYYGALALVLLPRKFTRLQTAFWRPFSISLWALAAALFFLPPRSQNFDLTILDVGQNELVHVEFPGRSHWLINTGRALPSDQARWILSPFLRQRGVKRIQGIVLTDLARRHTGGLTTVLRNFVVGSVLFSGSTDLSSTGRRVNRMTLQAGDQIALKDQDGFWIPAVAGDSVFLVISHAKTKVLFLPTLKPSVLKQALPRLRVFAGIDVLVLPARSGEISTVREVFSTLLPKHLVVSRPDPGLESCWREFEKAGTPVFFLSKTGALRFSSQQGKLVATPFLR